MASLNEILNKKKEIETRLKKIDKLIENKADQSEIESSFKRTKELIDEIEDEEELFGFFKYEYHLKNHLYLNSINKTKEAKKHFDISQRFKKYSQPNKKYDEDEDKAGTDDFIEYQADNETDDTSNEELKKQLDSFISLAEELTINSEKVFNKDTLNTFRCFVDGFIQLKPVTFIDYLKMNSMKLNLESLFDDIDMRLADLSSITNLDNLIANSTFLKEYLVKVLLVKCRIDFMKNALKSQNPIDLLYNGEIVDENINKKYKQLSLHFHPDKVIDWLPTEYLDLANDFFIFISEIREKLLKNHSKSNMFEYLEEANKYWTMSKDYKNILKGNYDKLEILNKSETLHLTKDDLTEGRKDCLNSAYTQYNAACKLADACNAVSDQVKIRGYISLIIYELGNDLLVSQLYALSALRLVIKHSNLLTEKELNDAKKIYRKVTTSADTNESNQTLNNIKEVVVKDSSQSLTIFDDCSSSSNSVVSSKISYENRQKFDNSISDHLNAAVAKLIVKSDREIVKYQVSDEEILRTKLQGKRHKTIGSVLLGTAVGAGGIAAGFAAEATIAAGTAVALGPIAWAGFGLFLLGAGLFNSFTLYKKGNEILKEPRIREKLNEILKNALQYFDRNMYDDFLKELSKQYTEGQKLISLESLNDSINSKLLISTLISHGFRPDGIAYLLNLIGEALISGRITSLGNFSSDDLKNQALKVFDATLDESLVKEAENLDKRIKELRLKNMGLVVKNLVIIKTSFKDFLSSRNYTSIAREHLTDSKSMSFRFRLEEMRNIARLNKAIMRLFKNQDDEIRLAENDIKDVRKSVDKNYQFVGKAALRLDAIEDFFWIISGKTIETLPAMTSNEPDIKLTGSNLNYLNNLNERLKITKTKSELCQIFVEKGDYYEKKANLNEKVNKIESLKDFKEALNSFNEALCIEKLNIDAGIGYARCLSKLSRYSKLIEYLKKNEHLSDIPEFWLLLSLAHLKSTNYDEARHSITQALDDSKFVYNKEILKQEKIIARLENTRLEKRLENYKKMTLCREETWFNKRVKLDSSDSCYNILSIDGGGIRGVIPTIWLCEIEKQTKRPISHLFNMISGTSIGAIVAAFLTIPKRETIVVNEHLTLSNYSKYIPEYMASDVVQMFREESKNIFSYSERSGLDSLLGTNLSSDKYSDKGKIQVFKKYFGECTLNDVLNDLVVPAVNQNDMSNTHLFNRYDVKKDSSINESLVNVVMASTAAPSFFPMYEIKNKGSFIDGGIHLNNPAMSAYTEALRYQVPKENIFVLSLGTGSYILDPFQPELCQGQLFWAQNFHKVALACQESNVDREMYHNLNNNYERWQVCLGKSVALDDYKQIDYLSELASQYIEEIYESDENEMNKLIEHLCKEN